MGRRSIYGIALAAALALLGVCLVSLWPPTVDFSAAAAVDRPPRIRPDYADTTLPPNMAPPNFLVEEPGEQYAVQIRSERGEVIHVTSRTAAITIPPSRWRQLLEDNRGAKLHFDIGVRSSEGQWTRFAPIVNTIADAPIDRYLYYRLMKPIYIVRINMAICQRDLQTYEESVVLDTHLFQDGCVNCHAFCPDHPDRMILQCRPPDHSPHWNGMIVVRDGEAIKVDTRAVTRTSESSRGRIAQSGAAYTRWHPNGQLAAFSANDISQFFHAVGENRDVFDAESDLGVYHVDSNTVTTTPEISDPDRLETFPAWSPDGGHLYFCSADPQPRDRYSEVRYDLMRISYDPDSEQWGDVEPILLAEDTGLSITEPRVSPDGRWVLFCMSDYGSFPAYRPSSDLYLLDLESRDYNRLEINSPRCESWHSWSSNSRWIAFASKREDGVFARIYLSHIDESGHAHKPVLLPQKSPTFYDSLIKTYNVPELANAPAPARGRELARAIRSPSATGGSAVDAPASMESMDVP